MRFLKYIIRACIRKICLVLSAILPRSGWRSRVRDFGDHLNIMLFRSEIEAFIRSYPKVLSEASTLRLLVEEGKSIARFGDGEFKLIIGERHKSFQDVDEVLNDRMLEVLKSKHPDVIVGIHPVRDFDGLGRIWQKFIIRIGREVLALLDAEREYASTGVFHRLPTGSPDVFEERISAIKQLWSGRKVLIVVGRNSRFHFEPELFDNVASVDYVYGPPKNAFHEYDRLINEVHNYDPKDYLVLLVLGPTATVMAYDLALIGYQAIDFGQMPSKYVAAKKLVYSGSD